MVFTALAVRLLMSAGSSMVMLQVALLLRNTLDAGPSLDHEVNQRSTVRCAGEGGTGVDACPAPGPLCTIPDLAVLGLLPHSVFACRTNRPARSDSWGSTWPLYMLGFRGSCQDWSRLCRFRSLVA